MDLFSSSDFWPFSLEIRVATSIRPYWVDFFSKIISRYATAIRDRRVMNSDTSFFFLNRLHFINLDVQKSHFLKLIFTKFTFFSEITILISHFSSNYHFSNTHWSSERNLSTLAQK